MNKEESIMEISQDTFHTLRKHSGDLMILIKSGIFEFKNGKIIIHKDSNGTIRKIEIESIAFKT